MIVIKTARSPFASNGGRDPLTHSTARIRVKSTLTLNTFIVPAYPLPELRSRTGAGA